MKLQTQIAWWFPFGLRLIYTGAPMTRQEWVSKTWRGYLAAWHAIWLVTTRDPHA